MGYFTILRYSSNLVCMFCAMMALSQNLIKNPSFEEFNHCPERLGNFESDVKYWSTPTAGSTDYFNGCSVAMGTPENFNGKQPADFGKGYAGLYLYAPNDYREYLQAELSKTLVRGKEYRVTFYVSLAERSDFAVKEFGLLFSKEKMEIPITKELSKKQRYKIKGNPYSYMEIGYSNFYSDTKDWVVVNTQFTATGNERYMVIGNFKSNLRTRKFMTKRNGRKGAYYYIDMVLLTAIEDKIRPTNLEMENKRLALEKTYTFQNIWFEFDTFKLSPASKIEMQELFEYLKEHSSLHIAIHGHTDSIGSGAYNQILSDNRAQSVASYLLHLGLSKDRIDWRGYGGKKPVAKNTTESGRQQNRRVEFIITEDSIDK